MSMLKHAASLPLGYSVEFEWTPPGRMDVRWAPDVPKIRSPRHRRKFFAAYVEARREFLEALATVGGGNVAVVDWAGKDGATINVVRPAVKH